MAAAFPAVVRQPEAELLPKISRIPAKTTVHPPHATPYQSNTEFCNTVSKVAAGEHLHAQMVIIGSVVSATP
jgi:hypothetical protein